MADNNVEDWDYGEFYKLNTVDILQLLQRALVPTSKKAFKKQMTSYLDFKLPSNYTPVVTNFKPLYRALLTYRTEFKQLYDFMSYKNQANVPKCSNKPGGLIKIFVSKIVPSHYGEAILETLEKSSYKHVDDFLSDFYKHVQRSYNTYMKAKDASYLLGDPVPFSATRPSNTSSSGSSLRKNTSQYQGDSRQEKHTLSLIHISEPTRPY